MKKLLSIILACAMIMSLFCVVPASATYNTTNQKLPYAFEDFEGADGTGATGLVAGNNPSYASVSVVTDATRGGHVLRAEAPNNTQGGATLLSYAYKETKEDTKESFCETFAAGETIVLSAWVKLGTVQDSASLRFILFHSSFTQLDATIANPLNTTSWQKVSTKYTFAAETTLSSIEMRFYGTSSDAHNVVMYVDDLEIKNDNTQPTQVGKVYSHNGKVTQWNPGFFQNQMAENGTTAVTMTGHDGADNVVSKVQYATTSATTNQLYQNAGGQSYTLAAGDKLEVELWVKLAEPTAHDKIYYAYSIATGTIWTIEFDGKSTDWQHLHRVVEMPAATSGTIFRNFTTNHESAGWSACMYNSNPKTAAGTYPVMYIDDFKMQAYTPVVMGIIEPEMELIYSHTGITDYMSNVAKNEATSIAGPDGSMVSAKKIQYKFMSGGGTEQIYKNYGGNQSQHFMVGDKVTISHWLKLAQPLDMDTGYYIVVTGTDNTNNNMFAIPFDGKSTEWQKVEGTFIIEKESTNAGNQLLHSWSGQYYPTNAYASIWNQYRMKSGGNWNAEDTVYPEFYVYGASFKLERPTDEEPVVGITTLPVASNAQASRGATGAISATYTLKTNMGVDIAAEEDKSFFKLVGATSGRVYSSSAALAGLVYPDAASEEIKLQIVPVTADYVGDVVEVAIIDLSAYNGIEIVDADDAFAVISTDTALANAKLIWVGYTDDTDHGYIEMTGTANIDVTMDAYSEQEFENPGDLGDWTFVKVFLWSDADTAYAPLAAYYEY